LAPPGTGHFTATVVSAFFLGDHVRLLLDAGSGSWVCAKVAGERRFVKGEHLHLKLDPTAILALKD
jgi:hypothetical protein